MPAKGFKMPKSALKKRAATLKKNKLLKQQLILGGAAPALPFHNQLPHAGHKSAPNLEALAQLLVEVSRLL